MRHASLLVPVLITTIVAVPLPGCTAIGYGVGAAIDSGKDKQVKPVGGPQDAQSVETGTRVELQLDDGRTLRGKYQGLDWAPSGEYAARHEAARNDRGAGLPALGHGARLALTSGTVVPGSLVGFGPGFVLFDEERGGEPARVPFHRVASLADAGGRTITGAQLEALIANKQVPILARLRLEQSDGIVLVPYEEVVTLGRVVSPHGARTAGLIVGAVADALLIAAAVSVNSGWDDSSSNTSYTSCPLVDSFDGEKWVLDAEPLGGAIYAAAQRRDLTLLPHLSEADGEYRLRLRNEQDEIDRVDAVALRVVDHDPGVEAVPGDEGRVLLVRDAVPPGSARDLRGVTFTSRLVATDGNAWASDPWGRRSDRLEDLRDGLELEFPRAPGTRRAALVLRAGATPFAGRALLSALALHGRRLPAFFTRLDGDPAARAAFEATWEREVLPTVRVWDGSQWRTSGFVRDLPARVMHDVAVPLDLEGIPGERVRVRIDGPPGLWSLDRAVLADLADERHEEQLVPLARAIGEDGEPLTDLLARADGRRHVLRPRRDRAILSFPAPARVPGRARTVLVELTGYYTPLVPVEGEGDPAAFQRLVREPGAIARFVIDGLRETPELAAARD